MVELHFCIEGRTLWGVHVGKVDTSTYGMSLEVKEINLPSRPEDKCYSQIKFNEFQR